MQARLMREVPAHDTIGRAALNISPMTESNLDRMEDAIHEAVARKHAAADERVNPLHDRVIGELYDVQRRYHAAWMEIEEARKTINFTGRGKLHHILRDVPEDYDRPPDKIDMTVDLREVYPTFELARAALKALTDNVLKIEARLSQLNAVIAFDRAPMEFQNRELILALAARVEALEAQLNAVGKSSKRKAS
jgi:hypothetical protein